CCVLSLPPCLPPSATDESTRHVSLVGRRRCVRMCQEGQLGLKILPIWVIKLGVKRCRKIGMLHLRCLKATLALTMTP
ncbi:hypothetical protein MYU51_005089, partial [Penicillium brevicompactum]